MQETIYSGFLEHSPGLVLQETDLLCYDGQFASSCSSGELVSFLYLLRQFHQVKLVLLAGSVRIHECDTTRLCISRHQVHGFLEVGLLRVEHDQLSLLVTSVIHTRHHDNIILQSISNPRIHNPTSLGSRQYKSPM